MRRIRFRKIRVFFPSQPEPSIKTQMEEGQEEGVTANDKELWRR